MFVLVERELKITHWYEYFRSTEEWSLWQQCGRDCQGTELKATRDEITIQMNAIAYIIEIHQACSIHRKQKTQGLKFLKICTDPNARYV